MNKSIFTFAALCSLSAGIVGSLGLSGCGMPEMYCLAPADAYAAAFTNLEGDKDCLPDHGRLGFDYYLGFNGEGDAPIADPNKARLAFTVIKARSKISEAKEHIRALKQYENCMGGQVDIETNFSEEFAKDAFYSIGDYNSPNPVDDRCTVGQMSKGSLTIPAMPAVPECKKEGFDVAARPEFKEFKMTVESLTTSMTVTPALQGLYVHGDFNYSVTRDDGTICSGKYRYEAINPTMDCLTDKECTDYQGTPDKSPKILVQGQLRCAGAVPKQGDTAAVPGICVLVPQK